MKYNRILGIICATLALAASFSALPLFAYSVETLPGMPVSNDFVVGPGKQELTLNPGESKTIDLTVTNRMGEDKTFSIGVEDFTGSQNVDQTVVLLGDDRGPYSLKDYISVPEKEFTLKHGERATIPVTISIPADAEPGGLYGSVVVSTVSRPSSGEGSGAAAVVSRIGTLFFVTVPGAVAREGDLQSFKIAGGKHVFSSGPIQFQLLFQNTGAIHLDPYGEIDIKNILGEEVGQMIVDPWFALPDSLRLREVSWDRGTLFGVYTATAKINRGYDDIIDEKSVTFVVVPWKYLLAAFGAAFLLILLVRFIASKFEIRRKN